MNIEVSHGEIVDKLTILQIKKEINLKYSSGFVEEKSYQQY